MHAAPSLPELQRQFLAALHDDGQDGPESAIAGRGLQPAARLRIYRNSCRAIHASALHTAYPAVVSLVGNDYFDQTAHGYRRVCSSRSGNLQSFGAHFAEYLETLPELVTLPYLPDVARLEWLRQQSVLAADAAPLSREAFTDALAEAGGTLRIRLHSSLQLLSSRYPVLTIWQYVMKPAFERLALGEGEKVVLWREHDEVVMGVVDGATFAAIASLARGDTFDMASAAAQARDAAFDLAACVASLLAHHLITGVAPRLTSCKGSSAC